MTPIGKKRGEALAQRAHEALEFIKQYHSANGIAPAMWEIATELYGKPNAGTTGRVLQRLEDDKFIVRIEGKARGIVLTVPQPRKSYLGE